MKCFGNRRPDGAHQCLHLERGVDVCAFCLFGKAPSPKVTDRRLAEIPLDHLTSPSGKPPDHFRRHPHLVERLRARPTARVAAERFFSIVMRLVGVNAEALMETLEKTADLGSCNFSAVLGDEKC